MPDPNGLPPVPLLISDKDFPRVPQQVRSRAKRDAMLERALALFGERGYEAVRIEDIATEASTGVGTFYAYFQSKQQVLLLLMQSYLETMLALNLHIVDTTQSFLEIIAYTVRRALVPDHAYAGLWRAWREAVTVDPVLANVDQRIITWMDTSVVVLINNFATLVPLRHDLDRQATATLINALLLQISQQPALQSDVIIDAATKMIYHTLIIDVDTSSSRNQKTDRDVED